eukprot:SAG31_NODE_42878_length_269_cov_1.211765_1_plen_27_part_01
MTLPRRRPTTLSTHNASFSLDRCEQTF